MGRAKAHKTDAIARPREAVPASVYDGIDFDAINAKISEYRQIVRAEGFDAALSRLAGEPVIVGRSKRSP
jgi:hypothetical protein